MRETLEHHDRFAASGRRVALATVVGASLAVADPDQAPGVHTAVKIDAKIIFSSLARLDQISQVQVDDLPQAARNYLDKVAELCDTPIDIISTGPDREETIVLNHPFE